MTRPLGFACAWDRPRERTWSGTPQSLLDALQRRASVADLGPDPGRALRVGFSLASVRRREGRWVRAWKWSAAYGRYAERTVSRGAERAECRAVLQIQDLARLRRPYYLYQDLSIRTLLELSRDQGLPGGFEATSRARLSERVERQSEIYAGATGVFAMSSWLADRLVAEGLERDRVHVLHPGSNIEPPGGWPELGSAGATDTGDRLLFVGRDFVRKGGDALLDAFAVLRARRPTARLTIVGPRRLPADATPPAGVELMGPLSRDRVIAQMLRHDAFVMPSRFEAFGIAAAEARCCGLPALVLDRFAMPEMVEDGRTGVLVDSLQLEELAHGLERLIDDRLAASSRDAAPAARRHWSWSRAADDVLARLAADGLGT